MLWSLVPSLCLFYFSWLTGISSGVFLSWEQKQTYLCILRFYLSPRFFLFTLWLSWLSLLPVPSLFRSAPLFWCCCIWETAYPGYVCFLSPSWEIFLYAGSGACMHVRFCLFGIQEGAKELTSAKNTIERFTTGLIQAHFHSTLTLSSLRLLSCFCIIAPYFYKDRHPWGLHSVNWLSLASPFTKCGLEWLVISTRLRRCIGIKFYRGSGSIFTPTAIGISSPSLPPRTRCRWLVCKYRSFIREKK